MSQPELIEGVHFYINADGYIVLTEKYHLEKDLAAAWVVCIVLIITRTYLNHVAHYYYHQRTNKQNDSLSSLKRFLVA